MKGNSLMKKNLLVFVSVLALSLISGCCCDKVCAAEKPAAKAKKHMIIGSWMIEDLPAATAKKIKPSPKAEITFERTKVYGCAGDNRFFGNLKIYGRELSFSQMGMTRMMGPNAQYEGYFMEALNKVAQYDVHGTVRLLDKNGKVLMVLKPKKK